MIMSIGSIFLWAKESKRGMEMIYLRLEKRRRRRMVTKIVVLMVFFFFEIINMKKLMDE